MKFYPSVCLSLFLLSCHSQKMISTNASNPAIGYYGRAMTDKDNDIILMGSASYIEFTFTSDSCVVYLKNSTYPGDYSYVVAEVDGVYKGRIKVDGLIPTPYTIHTTAYNSSHLLRLFKATESHNGPVIVTEIKGAGIKAAEHPVRKKIEFIGNSITAGMSSDTKDNPCGTGKWYDQHNAYLAYGPRIARAVGADFMISAVSGIGVYRNWNTLAPTMPQVYESAYLEIDSLQRWDFSRFTPDIVSINLGTNDFSNGDGKTTRLPFDSAVYIKTYVDFIGTIYRHYPSVQIALLSSPMLNGANRDILYACLQSVKAQAAIKYPGKSPIELFQFKSMVPNGCGYHPDIHDHEVLASEALPFFRKLVGK
jgi:lysophospholipase L1-like esterase